MLASEAMESIPSFPVDFSGILWILENDIVVRLEVERAHGFIGVALKHQPKKPADIARELHDRLLEAGMLCHARIAGYACIIALDFAVVSTRMIAEVRNSEQEA